MPDDFYVAAVQLDPFRVRLVARKPGEPVTAILTLGGSLMADATLNVDQTGALRVNWVDDKGDTDAPRPDGAVITHALADPSFGTITTDATNPDKAQLAPAKDGQVTLHTTIADANGQPIPLPDGTGNFGLPDYTVTITPGAAVGVAQEFVVEAQPAPTPQPAP